MDKFLNLLSLTLDRKIIRRNQKDQIPPELITVTSEDEFFEDSVPS